MENNSIKTLSNYEVDQLFIKFHAGDWNARNEIIEGTRYLVSIIINKKFTSKCRNRDTFLELRQIGILGLIDAVDKYNESYDAKFETYANYRIVGTICDYLRDNYLVHISPPTRKKAFIIKKELEKLNERYTKEEFNIICKSFGCNPKYIQYALATLDIQTGIDNLNNRALITSEESILNADIMVMRESFQCLTETEQEVIRMYYYEDKSMPIIATALGVTQPRISQIHVKAIGKLRQKMLD